ncbi:hypothetical protein [Helicobacter canis]|uniref:Uncharacterized protein n=1 Tax=Helicobacter canis TaxID=29419 RepID=A0A5M9QR49_9HELI|nr:hypothetical protein [Helicobacter canis]KAA8711143.1 hypothetical protein F4V45_01290 [Helicobacter canis]
MREVRNSEQTREISIYNSYGICVKSFTLEPSQSTLMPLSTGELMCFESCDRALYIYGGEGEIGIESCYREWDFEGIEAGRLDEFLQSGRADLLPSKSRQKYLDFKTLSEINLQAGRDILTPPRYLELWRELLELGGRKCKLIKL